MNNGLSRKNEKALLELGKVSVQGRNTVVLWPPVSYYEFYGRIGQRRFIGIIHFRVDFWPSKDSAFFIQAVLAQLNNL